MARRLPEFLIIGAAKSGTSSLWTLLNQHPDIFMCEPKEPQFFDEAVGWPNGIGWYESLFAPAAENQIIGEASTHYTRWPQVPRVPEKIHALLPDVKLIYVMRNPVERAFSHYVHRWTRDLHPEEPFSQTFDEFCKTDSVCIDSSLYFMQLEQYMAFFPKDRLLPVVFEELITSPESCLKKIFAFLGVNEDCKIDFQIPRENESKSFRYYFAKSKVRDRLMVSPITRTALKIMPTPVKTLIYDKLLLLVECFKGKKPSIEPIPLTDERRAELSAFFAESNRQLAETYNVDISYWK